MSSADQSDVSDCSDGVYSSRPAPANDDGTSATSTQDTCAPTAAAAAAAVVTPPQAPAGSTCTSSAAAAAAESSSSSSPCSGRSLHAPGRWANLGGDGGARRRIECMYDEMQEVRKGGAPKRMHNNATAASTCKRHGKGTGTRGTNSSKGKGGKLFKSRNRKMVIIIDDADSSSSEEESEDTKNADNLSPRRNYAFEAGKAAERADDEEEEDKSYEIDDWNLPLDLERTDGDGESATDDDDEGGEGAACSNSICMGTDGDNGTCTTVGTTVGTNAAKEEGGKSRSHTDSPTSNGGGDNGDDKGHGTSDCNPRGVRDSREARESAEEDEEIEQWAEQCRRSREPAAAAAVPAVPVRPPFLSGDDNATSSRYVNVAKFTDRVITMSRPTNLQPLGVRFIELPSKSWKEAKSPHPLASLILPSPSSLCVVAGIVAGSQACDSDLQLGDVVCFPSSTDNGMPMSLEGARYATIADVKRWMRILQVDPPVSFVARRFDKSLSLIAPPQTGTDTSSVVTLTCMGTNGDYDMTTTVAAGRDASICSALLRAAGARYTCIGGAMRGDSTDRRSSAARTDVRAGEQEIIEYPIGTAVSKDFDGIAYRGHVVSNDAAAKFYKIRYDDGDKEETDAVEVRRHLSPGPANQAGGNALTSAANDEDEVEDKRMADPERVTVESSGPKGRVLPNRKRSKPVLHVEEYMAVNASRMQKYAKRPKPAEDHSAESAMVIMDSLDEKSAAADDVPAGQDADNKVSEGKVGGNEYEVLSADSKGGGLYDTGPEASGDDESEVSLDAEASDGRKGDEDEPSENENSEHRLWAKASDGSEYSSGAEPPNGSSSDEDEPTHAQHLSASNGIGDYGANKQARRAELPTMTGPESACCCCCDGGSHHNACKKSDATTTFESGIAGLAYAAANSEDRKMSSTRANSGECRSDGSAKETLASLLQFYICPITKDLPIDPVSAGDGHVYEREAIQKYMHLNNRLKKVRSPVTKTLMERKLYPALNACNAIEHLVENSTFDEGSIDASSAEKWKKGVREMKAKKMVEDVKKKAEKGDTDAMQTLSNWYTHGKKFVPKNNELAAKWKQRKLALETERLALETERKAKGGDHVAMKRLGEWHKDGKNGFTIDLKMSRIFLANAKLVRDTTKKAEEGDTKAMHVLGDFYWNGECGLNVDVKRSYRWFKQAADCKNIEAMSVAGECLVNGWGTDQDAEHGKTLMVIAAGMGHDVACYNLAVWCLQGVGGLPKNKTEAKHWLNKIFDGSCTEKVLKPSARMQARKWLSEVSRK